jgi:flagellar assembly factor FliW
MSLHIATSRFGPLELETTDVIHFSAGVIGLERCQNWVLLADTQNELLGWLQSTERPEVALAVVSPRRFLPDYRVRISRRELEAVKLRDPQEAQVLVIVGVTDHGHSLNLKAPLVFNLESRLGAQVVAKDDHPLQFLVAAQPAPLKKSA